MREGTEVGAGSRSYVRHDGMRERLTHLREKEVVNLRDGTKVGFVTNMELGLDGKTGRVVCLVIPRRRSWPVLLKGRKEVQIPWHKVRRVSGELIIVDFELKE